MNFDWMISMAEPFLNTVLPAIVLVGLVEIGLRCFPGLNGASRYAAWLLALLIVVVSPLGNSVDLTGLQRGVASSDLPPVSSIPAVPQTEDAISPLPDTQLAPLTSESDAAPAMPTTSTASVPSKAGSTTQSTPIWRFNESLILAGVSVWLIVALLMALPVIRSAWAVRRMKRAATTMPQALEQRVRHWAKRLSIRQPVTLMGSDGITVPVTTGLIRPVILLPASSARTLDESTLDHTLIHELAHIKRKDHWVKPIQVIVCALVWFHPALWWINRKLNLEREIACDEAVLIHANTKPNRYAQSLILWAEGALNHRINRVAVPFIVRSQLEKRVTTMMKSKKKLTLKLSKTRLLLLAGVVGIAITVLAPLFPAIGVTDVESNLYWVRDGVLERAGLDASDIETIASDLSELPDQVLHYRLPPTIDPLTQSVYWVREVGPGLLEGGDDQPLRLSSDNSQIVRSSFNGGEPEVLASGYNLSNLYIDQQSKKMYWVGYDVSEFETSVLSWPGTGEERMTLIRTLGTNIFQANLDGSEKQIVVRFEADMEFDSLGETILAFGWGELAAQLRESVLVLKVDGASGKLIFFDDRPDGFYMANLDGSQRTFVPWPNDFLGEVGIKPTSAVHIKIVQEDRLRMYWKDQRGRILRINLDGADADYQQVLYNMEEGLVGRFVRKLTEFDFAGRHIYWLSQPSLQSQPVLRKISLDEPEFAFRNGLHTPILFDFSNRENLPPAFHTIDRYGVSSLIVDEQNEKLYWALWGRNENSPTIFAIQQSDLDGNNVKILVDGLPGRLTVFELLGNRNYATPVLETHTTYQREPLTLGSEKMVDRNISATHAFSPPSPVFEGYLSINADLNLEAGSELEFHFPIARVLSFSTNQFSTKVIGEGFSLSATNQSQLYQFDFDEKSESLIVRSKLPSEVVAFRYDFGNQQVSFSDEDGNPVNTIQTGDDVYVDIDPGLPQFNHLKTSNITLAGDFTGKVIMVDDLGNTIEIDLKTMVENEPHSLDGKLILVMN